MATSRVEYAASASRVAVGGGGRAGRAQRAAGSLPRGQLSHVGGGGLHRRELEQRLWWNGDPELPLDERRDRAVADGVDAQFAQRAGRDRGRLRARRECGRLRGGERLRRRSLFIMRPPSRSRPASTRSALPAAGSRPGQAGRLRWSSRQWRRRSLPLEVLGIDPGRIRTSCARRRPNRSRSARARPPAACDRCASRGEAEKCAALLRRRPAWSRRRQRAG